MRKLNYCTACDEWVEGQRTDFRCLKCGRLDMIQFISDAAHKFARVQMIGSKLKEHGAAWNNRYDAAYWGAMLALEDTINKYKALDQPK